MTSSTDARKSARRRELIERREALEPEQRLRLDAAIGQAVVDLVERTAARRVAAFVAHRGEPDLMPVLQGLVSGRASVFLPVVEGKRMRFLRWRPGCEMQRNRFGIPEPVGTPEVAAPDLDLVLLPLVGFGDGGERLGMGAGFYDRAFAFCREAASRTPRLVGVAYGVQRVPELPVDDWDVPLDGVVTEDGLRSFARS